jgi:phosphoribosylanthranilate isomerase
MPVEVKICGIRDAEGMDAAVAAGADLIGFVFFPPSPRAVTPDQAAALSARHAGGPVRVGLFVDPTDEDLAAVLAVAPLGLLQLHGEETPARAAAIRARFGLPVMKAIGVGTAADLDALDAFAPVVDRFLLDARPPPGGPLPGGNAQPFEWRLAAGRAIPRPWLLAGGLMAFAVWLVRAEVAGWPPAAQLAVLVPLGAAAYLGGLWVVARPYLSESWAMIRQREMAPA